MELDFTTIKKGFKAFRIDKFGQLRSWSVIFDRELELVSGEYQIYYPKQWTIREEGRGPFSLFETYENASNFRHTFGKYIRGEKVIRSVLYIPSYDTILYITNKLGVIKYDPFKLNDNMITDPFKLNTDKILKDVISTPVLADGIYVL